jgi:hypothetical protein
MWVSIVTMNPSIHQPVYPSIHVSVYLSDSVILCRLPFDPFQPSPKSRLMLRRERDKRDTILCNKFYNKLRDLWLSSDVVAIEKSIRLWWFGHVTGMGKTRNAYIILGEKYFKNDPLEDSLHWKIIFKSILCMYKNSFETYTTLLGCGKNVNVMKSSIITLQSSIWV